MQLLLIFTKIIFKNKGKTENNEIIYLKGAEGGDEME